MKKRTVGALAALTAITVLTVLLVGYRNEEFLLTLSVDGVVTDENGQALGDVSAYFIDVDLHEIKGTARTERLLAVSDENGHIRTLFHYRYGHSSIFGFSGKHDTFSVAFRRQGCSEKTVVFSLSGLERTDQGQYLPFRTAISCTRLTGK